MLINLFTLAKIIKILLLILLKWKIKYNLGTNGNKLFIHMC